MSVASRSGYYALMFGAFPPEFYLSGKLPVATVGESYSGAMVAHNSLGSLVWDVIGELPDGLEIDRETGEIAGTPWLPLEIQEVNFLAVVDRPFFARIGVSGSVGRVTWALIGGELPPSFSLSENGAITGVASVHFVIDDFNSSAISGIAFSKHLSTTGAIGTTVWELVDGALPPGLSLLETGKILGTPT